MSMPFDTLKFAERLAAGGFTVEQGKTAAAAFSEAFRESIATKADVNHATERLEARLEALELRMTVKTGGMFVVAIGIMGALFKLFH